MAKHHVWSLGQLVLTIYRASKSMPRVSSSWKSDEHEQPYLQISLHHEFQPSRLGSTFGHASQWSTLCWCSDLHSSPTWLDCSHGSGPQIAALHQDWHRNHPVHPSLVLSPLLTWHFICICWYLLLLCSQFFDHLIHFRFLSLWRRTTYTANRDWTEYNFFLFFFFIVSSCFEVGSFS